MDNKLVERGGRSLPFDQIQAKHSVQMSGMNAHGVMFKNLKEARRKARRQSERMRDDRTRGRSPDGPGGGPVRRSRAQGRDPDRPGRVPAAVLRFGRGCL